MFMDDINCTFFFEGGTKSEKELKTLTQTLGIYSQDIEMEFGIGKCALLIMGKGKI